MTEITVWQPNPGPQTALIACPVFEVFYGGARGGGKTDGVLGDWLRHASLYREHASGLMVRRTRAELVDTIERSRAIYGPLGWTYNETEKLWRAPDGGRLRFAYLERDADAEAYQGHSYTRVYVEEIGNFPSPGPVFKLFATLRSGVGVPVGFRATGNPGGPGHAWVRRRYIDPHPTGWRIVSDAVTGLQRVYIPSRVADNPKIGVDYVPRLKASGSPQLVKAWLDGDWNAIEGAFFECFNTAIHVVEPFVVPEEWTRFRSMDWGSAAPFSVGWWAVVGDEFRGLPRGCLVRYREWYGASEPNVGLKMTAEEVACGILERDQGETNYAKCVLDPAAFSQDGGPSIAERIAAGTDGKVWFTRADNRRVARVGAIGGWDQVRARLMGNGDGKPMMVFFSTCPDAIRTLPMLQHDPDRPEDVMTDSEDHAPDEIRYACMSRPWVTEIERPQDAIKEMLKPMTLQRAIEEFEAERVDS